MFGTLKVTLTAYSPAGKPGPSGTFGIVSGNCTLLPGDRNTVATGSTTCAEHPGMPSAVRSIGGVACVSERSSAPQLVPAAMPLSCHCSVVPSTGAALASSARPSNDVGHSENGVDNVAERSRPAGIVTPPPGAQPTRIGSGE